MSHTPQATSEKGGCCLLQPGQLKTQQTNNPRGAGKVGWVKTGGKKWLCKTKTTSTSRNGAILILWKWKCETRL